MLENTFPREELRALARRKFKETESKSVDPNKVSDHLKDGWHLLREGKTSCKFERIKPHNRHLEDRVWSLFYRMGFSHLSGEGGAQLTTLGDKGSLPLKNQLDCVALDNEVAVASECKSSKEIAKRGRLQEEIAKLGAARGPFARATQSIGGCRRSPVACMFLRNAILSETDIARAKEANVVLFDDNDLTYYEELVTHLGSAARYQFLADVMPPKADVPGLSICVPAIRIRMGGGDAYMFAISPEFLLKISYVSHRQKGKASDINTYQRMMKRSRLKKIREFIEDQGIFPTNIVVNIDTPMLRFEKASQNSVGATSESGVLGWLHVKPRYKSAWVIDGQHRLFGYSGSAKAEKARLTVLAFSGLKPNEQAGMFIDINSKQKSVKQSLLQELYAELHWDAADPKMRVRAIISKVVQVLNGEKGSPFFGRIQTADEGKDDRRCISLTSMFGALDKSELYIANEKHGEVVEYGPFWHPDGQIAMRRTTKVVNEWFRVIVTPVTDWWDLGSGEGGGLSMNDGVVSLLGVLRSVLAHLSREVGYKLVSLSDQELVDLLRPFAVKVADYLKELTVADRRAFRALRGVQGVTTRQRRMQQAVHQAFPKFNPSGLEEFLRNEKAQTNKQARELIDEVEVCLQQTIIEELKHEFGQEEAGWWFKGVPAAIRKDVSARLEEDAGKRGGKEHYFNLIHYRVIITANWELFCDIFAYPKKGAGKEKGTEWIQKLNEWRNAVMHKSSGVHMSMEELDKIRSYSEWLRQQIESPASEADPSTVE